MVLFAIRSLYPMGAQVAMVVSWIPARTASSMTVFALGAMALYARSLRLGSVRASSLPSPLDPPATKGSIQSEARATTATWPLFVGSLILFALALGCYEQAVMMPLLVVIVAFGF